VSAEGTAAGDKGLPWPCRWRARSRRPSKESSTRPEANNILVTASGIKLLDFGLAKYQSQAAGADATLR